MDNKIALFIDAENVSYKNAKRIIDILEARGTILVREIVGDWTKIKSNREQADGWQKAAIDYSMTGTQQFNYVSGKNTCDIALIIRAMKALYEKLFLTTFCLVTNDSDFTRLAQELREQNKEVIGMGERGKATPEFVSAFVEYIYLNDVLEAEKPVTEKPKPVPQPAKSKNGYGEFTEEQVRYFEELVGGLIDEYDGKAPCSLISDGMKKKFPDFTPANFGCKIASQLIEKTLVYTPAFKSKKEKMQNNPNGFHYSLIKL